MCIKYSTCVNSKYYTVMVHHCIRNESLFEMFVFNSIKTVSCPTAMVNDTFFWGHAPNIQGYNQGAQKQRLTPTVSCVRLQLLVTPPFLTAEAGRFLIPFGKAVGLQQHLNISVLLIDVVVVLPPLFCLIQCMVSIFKQLQKIGTILGADCNTNTAGK